MTLSSQMNVDITLITRPFTALSKRLSNLERSYAVLEGYGKIRCFLDRDRAGITALETLNIHFGNKITDCSGLYDGFKDLNEYLTKTKENK